jgi:NAD(P)-dependent dehydrogenase (short-subunit alcohol dehydrogenase family)
MNLDFKGKTVVITGGASGIGASIRIEFTVAGAITSAQEMEKLCSLAVSSFGSISPYFSHQTRQNLFVVSK